MLAFTRNICVSSYCVKAAKKEHKHYFNKLSISKVKQAERDIQLAPVYLSAPKRQDVT